MKKPQFSSLEEADRWHFIEYLENRKQVLIEQVGCLGKWVVIFGDSMVESFDTEEDAVKVGYEFFGDVPYYVKKVELFDIIPQKILDV